MSLRPQVIAPIPEETAGVAHAIFPDGNTSMRMPDELGTIYQDQDFADLFPGRGQPAEGLTEPTHACTPTSRFAKLVASAQQATAV